MTIFLLALVVYEGCWVWRLLRLVDAQSLETEQIANRLEATVRTMDERLEIKQEDPPASGSLNQKQNRNPSAS